MNVYVTEKHVIKLYIQIMFIIYVKIIFLHVVRREQSTRSGMCCCLVLFLHVFYVQTNKISDGGVYLKCDILRDVKKYKVVFDFYFITSLQTCCTFSRKGYVPFRRSLYSIFLKMALIYFL